jgi:hypothetical protein
MAANVGNISFLTYSSEEWENGVVRRAMGNGEIGFEIVSVAGGETDVYILKGDGLLPGNGDYRRLRITGSRKELADRFRSLADRLDAAESGLSDAIAAEAARASVAEADIRVDVSGNYAPLVSPIFSGVPQAPLANFANSSQIAVIDNIKPLYGLTIDTAGAMLRSVDGFNPSYGIPYERKFDRVSYAVSGEPLPDIFLETDNAGCCWNAPFVEKRVFYRKFGILFDLIMATAGENVLLTDSVRGRPSNRKVDRRAGLPEIVREFDCRVRDPFDGCTWVDPVSAGV